MILKMPMRTAMTALAWSFPAAMASVGRSRGTRTQSGGLP